jgi:hypothetical protein
LPVHEGDIAGPNQPRFHLLLRPLKILLLRRRRGRHIAEIKKFLVPARFLEIVGPVY